MPLEIPQIDSRDYHQILEETLVRIPVHNPEWTNFSESDPGVTILQLFAFMNESLLYRCNLIPERNRLKFLSLLGIPMQAAAAAQGFVVIKNESGTLETIVLPPDLELMAGNVPFRTLNALDVPPIEARIYYKRKLSKSREAEVRELYAQLYASYEEVDELVFYETMPLELPTNGSPIPVIDLGSSDVLDRSLWIALMARPRESVGEARKAIAGKTLNIGIMPDITEISRTLLPAGFASSEGQATLLFEIATDQFHPATRVPRYNRLNARTDTDIMINPGVVQVALPGEEALRMWEITEPLEAGVGDYPPSLEDTKVSERVITWIRVRLPEEQTGSGLSARISWVGINATRVVQRAHISSENLGLGTGEPDQSTALINTPVIPGTVDLTVDGETWSETDDLLIAGPEVPLGNTWQPSGPRGRQEARVFTVDRESGEIRFGDGVRGARPPEGAIIRASYDYGGGRRGNVSIGVINKAPALPPGLKVTNPLPTWGGDERESVSEAERNISRYLRHKDRLVTAEDFEDIVRRSPGVDVGRVEMLALFNPQVPDATIPGTVTVMIVPRYDAAHPEAPMPDRLFLELICKHLEPRRMVTTELHVTGPKYKNVYVSVGIEVAAGYDLPPVREAVNDAIRKFLSPLKGGRDGTGWPLEKAVVARELWGEVNRVDGVAYVTDLLLGDDSGFSAEQVSMSGLELPRVMIVGTRQGDPETLEQMIGEVPVPPKEAERRKKIVPVPVVPIECRG